jgi:3-methyladenine DNA glycosylase/8-oxoguanine DNA glycosylase
MTGMDGLTRRRGGVLHRLLQLEGEPVHLRVAQLTGGNVLFGARSASRESAAGAIAAMRRALGVDLDLAPFYEQFKSDPLIGAAVRADPAARITGRPDPFEALWFAVCEQLIEYERAAAIERQVVRALGRFDESSRLWEAPDARVLAGVSPALLQSLDLSAGRALALVRAAREVSRGRVRLDPATHERSELEQSWRRLRLIPGIGAWTVEMLALYGQGRLDQLPAGDLGYLKYVGRILSGGDPWARASEQQVREFFARFGEWKALAATYALRLP